MVSVDPNPDTTAILLHYTFLDNFIGTTKNIMFDNFVEKLSLSQLFFVQTKQLVSNKIEDFRIYAENKPY